MTEPGLPADEEDERETYESGYPEDDDELGLPWFDEGYTGEWEGDE